MRSIKHSTKHSATLYFKMMHTFQGSILLVGMGNEARVTIFDGSVMLSEEVSSHGTPTMHHSKHIKIIKVRLDLLGNIFLFFFSRIYGDVLTKTVSLRAFTCIL